MSVKAILDTAKHHITRLKNRHLLLFHGHKNKPLHLSWIRNQRPHSKYIFQSTENAAHHNRNEIKFLTHDLIVIFNP